MTQHGGAFMGLQYSHLCEIERYRIEALVLQGYTDAEIARVVHRHRSTIGRERLRGLWAAFGHYTAELGRRHYAQARRRAGLARRKLGPDLSSPAWQHLIQGLRCDHSPQIIAGRLRAFDPLHGRGSMHPLYVSHETIYRALYGLPRSPVKTELISHLWQSRAARRRLQRGRRRCFTGVQDMTPISQRPAHVLNRREPGHWEGDLVKGASGHSAIGTLVERTSRKLLLVQLPDCSSASVLQAFTRRLAQVPAPLRQSLAYDRGTEMARHKDLTGALNMPVFFCDAYSPWQRPTNENTNGLLRRYLPKGMDLSELTQADLCRLEQLLNDRPRRVLGYKTSNEVYDQLCAQLSPGAAQRA
jgi:IS30 family transposase